MELSDVSNEIGRRRCTAVATLKQNAYTIIKTPIPRIAFLTILFPNSYFLFPKMYHAQLKFSSDHILADRAGLRFVYIDIPPGNTFIMAFIVHVFPCTHKVNNDLPWILF